MTEATSTIIQGGLEILDIILSPQLQERLLPLKIFFIVCFVAFVLLFIYFSKVGSFWTWGKVSDIKTFLTARPAVFAKKFVKKWQKIKKNALKESPAQRKLSLIRAYGLLNDFLVSIGLDGESLEAKVDQLSEGQISDQENLLKAIRVCQDILRDPDFKLTKDQAKEVVHIFGKAFIDLELL